MPTQAPASGDDEGGPPFGTLAFDCPRPDGSGIVFCLGTPGGQLQPVVSPPLKRFDGGACCAEWSPDGQRVLIRLSRSVATLQRDDVGMVNADGSGLVNLTNEPARGNWGATWSPDGRRIVFNSGSRLFVMNADGSHLKKITRNRAMIAAMVRGGLRRCQVLGLRMTDLRVAEKRVFIADGKGGHQRLIPVSTRFFTAVASYLDAERPPGVDTDRVPSRARLHRVHPDLPAPGWRTAHEPELCENRVC